MIYEQSGFKLTGNHLWLSKIGEMRIELSRPVPGRIKQIVVKHTPAHKWFVAVISETPDTPEPTTGTRAVGIDLNLENFSTDTEGTVFPHPHNVMKAAKRLRRAQRKLSRAADGSRNAGNSGSGLPGSTSRSRTGETTSCTSGADTTLTTTILSPWNT